MIPLLPCPFCGATNQDQTADFLGDQSATLAIDPSWGMAFVYCRSCMCAGPEGADEAAAVEKWNSRPEAKP